MQCYLKLKEKTFCVNSADQSASTLKLNFGLSVMLHKLAISIKKFVNGTFKDITHIIMQIFLTNAHLR